MNVLDELVKRFEECSRRGQKMVNPTAPVKDITPEMRGILIAGMAVMFEELTVKLPEMSDIAAESRLRCIEEAFREHAKAMARRLAERKGSHAPGNN